MPTPEELAAAAALAAVVVPAVVEPVVVPVVVEPVVIAAPEFDKARNMAALLDETTPVGVDSFGNVTEVVKPVSENVPTFIPSKMWNQLKERISTTEVPWEIPESIAKGEFGEGKSEFDAYLDTIYANTDFSGMTGASDDPFIQAYNQAKAGENFDKNEWLKGQAGEASIFDLKGKEFMNAYYTKFKLKNEANPDGYTQEDIDTYINSKNRIEIDKESDVLKKVLKDSTADQDKANLKIIKDREIVQFNKQEETNQLRVSKFVKANEFAKDFYGIEFSEAERTQFFKDLPGLFKRDPATKLSTIDSLMQSESEILSVAALIWKGKDGLKGQISNLKEAVKTELEKKLGVSSIVEKGTVVTYRQKDDSKLV